MKNPFKPERSPQDRDNPVVPNVVEGPVERAADRAPMYDNPLVPNAIERPVERAMADDRDAVVNRSGIADRPGIDDGPGDRRGVMDTPSDIARGRALADGAAGYRPLGEEHGYDRSGVMPPPSGSQREVSSPSTVPGSGQVDSAQMELFPADELHGYRTRWETVQTGFVDEPRAAVEQADALVSQVVTRLTEVFTRERSRLEGQWTKGDNVSTEDLRIALMRYRSFFNRLLSM